MGLDKLRASEPASHASHHVSHARQMLVPSLFSFLRLLAVSQRFGHPRVLGIPIPISLAFWESPVGDAQNADHFDFA